MRTTVRWWWWRGGVPCFLMPQNSLLTSWRFSHKLKYMVYSLLPALLTLAAWRMTYWEGHLLRDECRQFDNALQRRGCWSKRQFSTSVFTFVHFFKISFENSMILPAAFFLMHWCLCVLRTLPLSLSLTWTVVGWASFSAHLSCWYSNDQNHWSRSGTCWQPSELSVEVRNLLSGANRFSPCRWILLYQRARSHVLQLLWNTTSCTRRWEMLESVFFFFWCYHANALFWTARQLSTDLESLEISCRQENSRRVTRSHIFVFILTAFSVVACVLLHACSFVSHPSLHTAKGGIILLDVVSENIPSWHGLCLSCMVIASAAILLLCWLPLLRSGYLMFYCIFNVKLETGDSQDLKYGVYRIRREGEEESSLLPSSSSLPLFVVCVCLGGREAGRSGGGDKKWQIADFRKGQLEAHGWLGERSDRNAWMTSGEIWSGRDTHALPI